MIYIILSFIFESIISSKINIITNPLFVLITLLIFIEEKQSKTYFKIVFITGLIYDIIITTSLFYNAILFLITTYIIKKIYDYINISNLFKILLILLGLLIYQLLIYITLTLINYISFNPLILLENIYNMFLTNILYILLLVYINPKLKNKKAI